MRCAAISLYSAICIKHPHNVIGTHANTSKKKSSVVVASQPPWLWGQDKLPGAL